MSNPAVYNLAEMEIGNIKIRVEDNLGESIHVHIGNFRVSLTVKEFYSVVEQIQKGADILLKLNGLGLDMFDRKSFDWDWLSRYEEFQSIEIVNIELGHLLTKGPSPLFPSLDTIIPLAESRQVKALKGMRDELERYKEINEYGVSNVERLNKVLKIIKKKGYPFDGKYILINQYNQIYDGDHRAACLLFLYGERFEIPVMRINLKNEISIEEQKKNIEQLIEKRMEQSKNQLPSKHIWPEALNDLNVTMDAFLKEIEVIDIPYYLIEHPWMGRDGQVVAQTVLVLQEGKMIEFCKAMKVSYFGESKYRHWNFLYSMQRCVFIKLLDTTVLVFDRLACKSKFENAIMPLDKSIQAHAWNTKISNRASIQIEIVYVIVNALLNGLGFDEGTKNFLNQNVIYLESEETRNLLEKIFFKYTEELISCLKVGEYEMAYSNYVVNRNY